MKATGEVMSIGSSFEQAIMKAVRSIELGLDTLTSAQDCRARPTTRSGNCCIAAGRRADFRRISRHSSAALTSDTIYDITKIDQLVPGQAAEPGAAWNMSWQKGSLDEELYLRGQGRWASWTRPSSSFPAVSCALNRRMPAYKMVDTCAAEFDGPDPLLLLHL